MKDKQLAVPGYYNMDCMEGMKDFPDKFFDLAIVDPPYGDCRKQSDDGEPSPTMGGCTAIHKLWNAGEWSRKNRRNLGDEILKKIKAWDFAPQPAYFQELRRVSRHQIIWGGNYFDLPPTRCFVVCRKTNVPEKFTMAMAEYAWTSFNDNAKVFDYSAVGQEGRFHPTQKPVALYKWLLANFAKKGDVILDTHVGSASSLIACEDMGFDYVGFEIDKEYYNKGVQRLDEFNAQVRMPL